MRIAIAGVPGAGKTTLAESLAAETGFPLVHGDDFMEMGWSEASAELARRLLSPGPYIIEGVAVSRALRKALGINGHKPCDRLYWLEQPHIAHSPGQAAMAKGCATVQLEIAAELRRRGVELIVGVGGAKPVSGPAKPVAPAAPATRVIETPVASGSRWGASGGRGFG